jgi:hypothetical protein
MCSVHHIKAQKINKVSLNDPDLKTEVFYDNPRKIMYNVGATVGADGSATSAAVYADFSGFLNIKPILIRANYSLDITKSNYISAKHPLADKFSPYSNFQISGFINIKDEETTINSQPIVGIDVIERVDENTVRGAVYGTDQTIKVRIMRGIGGSVIFHSGNNYSTSKTNTDHLTFVNQGLNPNEFVLPYTAVTVGVGFQTGRFKAFNYKYTYKNLKPYKFKEKYFKVQTYELLYAPSISYERNIWVSANNVTFEAEVEEVKKFPFGIRTLLIQNFYSGKKRAKKPGFYTNVEVGMRPGIYSKIFPESLYVRFGVGLTT